MSGDTHPGNEAGVEPRMLLQKGYSVGNPVTDAHKDNNEKVPYAHRMALISDEYFELAKSSCDGEYMNPDPINIRCLYALRLVDEVKLNYNIVISSVFNYAPVVLARNQAQCTSHINEQHILEPKCKLISSRPIFSRSRQLFLEDDSVDLISLSKQEKPWCRHYNYVPSYVWANSETVQEALQIRQGTITDWKRFNRSLSYEEDVESVFTYHQLLNEKSIQALAYSGDHDMVMLYMGTLKWICDLNLTLDEDWRSWTVDGQVARVQVIQL
ncbi:UNVERIFIED_CONTAM: Serine carboxypeptidase-like 18 [Sesamum radiatum]|uniref:Serine carboxypeptidase-like 18 n=1 Tax=Sesamum radiatum TaxID=300843 RepID=A0AAW2RVU1_SESRA